jgi:hypothetical protein
MENQLSSYWEWNLKGTLSEGAIFARLQSRPFIETSDSSCLLQCGNSYRAESTGNDGCMNNSCKAIIVANVSSVGYCGECWKQEELDWISEGSQNWYSRRKLSTAVQSTPFVFEDKQC